MNPNPDSFRIRFLQEPRCDELALRALGVGHENVDVAEDARPCGYTDRDFRPLSRRIGPRKRRAHVRGRRRRHCCDAGEMLLVLKAAGIGEPRRWSASAANGPRPCAMSPTISTCRRMRLSTASQNRRTDGLGPTRSSCLPAAEDASFTIRVSRLRWSQVTDCWAIPHASRRMPQGRPAVGARHEPLVNVTRARAMTDGSPVDVA